MLHCWLVPEGISMSIAKLIFSWVVYGLLLWVLDAQAVDAADPPSVIVIIADDQGWGDLSCHGNRNLATPHLDALRSQGVSFDRFYVQPVCSPTRAELLTSCYAPRGGVTGVTAGGERLDPNYPTLAAAFRKAGYATAAFGKWHNGTQAPYHPLCRGFDSFYGFTSGHWADYFSPMLDRDGEITRGTGFLPDEMTDEVIKFCEGNRERPYFALVAYNTPHSPMQVPERWWNKHADQMLEQVGSRPENEEHLHTRAALAMCENLDWNVGRVLTALDRLKISDNTIVVYLTDNGPNGHRFNGGMRGIKGSTDEGGVRSPLFIRWPNKIEAGLVVTTPAAVIDLGPTLTELTGISLLKGPSIDGVSLTSAVLGKADQFPERTLFSHWAGRIAARRGSMLLDERGRLYDLGSDPNQTHDVSSQRPEVTHQLQREVETWRREVCVKNAKPKPPFSIGHPQLPSTQLPVRDATSTGEIRRSNRHKNSTYFTNWVSTDDTIQWDVEVVEPGRFRAEVYYTCSPEDEGSLIELRLGDQTCRGQVAPAFDPPLRAAKNDRFPRQEGDMKDFRRLSLGELDLPAMRGKLNLRAVEIPGRQVMDVRLLELTRLN